MLEITDSEHNSDSFTLEIIPLSRNDLISSLTSFLSSLENCISFLSKLELLISTNTGICTPLTYPKIILLEVNCFQTLTWYFRAPALNLSFLLSTVKYVLRSLTNICVGSFLSLSLVFDSCTFDVPISCWTRNGGVPGPICSFLC